MNSIKGLCVVLIALAAAAVNLPSVAQESEGKLRVVATLADYAWVAREVGGDRVDVHAIARGNQDAHFVRPRPSYTALMRNADLFISTGLDLELWVPTLLDAAGNPRILEGADGYVAAWPGIEMLDVPSTLSRTEGDVHIYGNPHIHTDPLNVVIIARNVLAGLQKVDPAHAEEYAQREKALEERIHRRLFGEELVELLGGETLARLARSGKLESFLKTKEYPRGSGRTLADRLGGWLAEARPPRPAPCTVGRSSATTKTGSTSRRASDWISWAMWNPNRVSHRHRDTWGRSSI